MIHYNMGGKAGLLLALAAFAPPASAAAPAACAAEGLATLYAFLAGRSLAPGERALVVRETLARPEQASPQDCATRAELAKLAATADPVLRADRRAALHNAAWFALPPRDPRRALLQRIAPISAEDPARKIAVRRAALEAFLASRAFAARQWGVAPPPAGLAAEVAATRAGLAKAPAEAARMLMYQEGYWEALRRRWPARPAAWRRATLARIGKPGAATIDERTARLQMAVARPVGSGSAAGRGRAGSAMIANWGKMGLLAGIYGSR